VIPKLSRGGSVRGLVAYLAGPGRGNEHTNPHVVAGDPGLDGGDLTARVGEVAEHLDEPRQALATSVLVKGKDAHVWHASLSLAPGESLDDDGWRQVAEGFVKRMGFDQDCRWAAVHHGLSAGHHGERGQDHCHVVVQLVQEDGKPANVWNDRDRAHKACAEIEREHGLQGVEGRELGVGERGYTRGERAIAERAGRSETQRQYLERAVRGCMVTSHDAAGFKEQLARGGIQVQWRVKDGRRVGYGVVGEDGVPYAGGKLARDLSYPRLEEHWRTGTPQTADQAARLAAGQRAWQSLEAEPAGQPGDLARESRELGRFAQTRAGAGPLVLPVLVAQLLRQRIVAAEREAEQRRELEERDRVQRRSPQRGRDNGIGL